MVRMLKREIIYIFPKKILCEQMQKVGENSRKGEYFTKIMTYGSLVAQTTVHQG